jgi:hypothetical protein
MRRFFIACLPALALSTACTQSPEEDQGSSSDLRTGGSIVIPGTSTVPPGVDPNQLYADSRSIKILDSVGQLTADERAVLVRADGMVASAPADGRVSVDELAQLAAPNFVVILTPGEKVALRTVWRVMKAPKETSVHGLDVTPKTARFTLASVNVIHGEPTVIPHPAPRTSFGLTELDQYGQEPLGERIEKGFDSDSNSSTISIADLDAASHSGAFTPDEISTMTWLKNTLVAFAANEAQQVSDNTPKTLRTEIHELPYPAEGASDDITLSDSAGLHAGIYRGTYIAEDRSRPTDGSGPLAVKLSIHQDWGYSVRSPDRSVVELDPRTGSDSTFVAGPGQGLPFDPLSETLVELWQGGEAQARVRIPVGSGLPSSYDFDLRDYYGYALYARTADGSEVALWDHVYSEYQSGNSLYATYRFDTTTDSSYEPGYYLTTLHPELRIAATPGRYLLDLPYGSQLQVDVGPVDPFASVGDSVDRRPVLVSFPSGTEDFPAGVVAAAVPSGAGERTAVRGRTTVKIGIGGDGDKIVIEQPGDPLVTVRLEATSLKAW